ncbi:mitochondrial carrier homolog 2-like [Dysidea avara]|uniref:mitochondrial carrier homolog 2-like n=1 Tax=Dysidea avara TaxID=196820 RepID=UPI00331E6556
MAEQNPAQVPAPKMPKEPAPAESRVAERARHYATRYGYILCGSFALHPLTLVRTLVQAGVEPIEPTVRTSYFGNKSLVYPGIFTYGKHIVSVDGWTGLFRGSIPQALYAVLTQAGIDFMAMPVHNFVFAYLKKVLPPGPDVPDNEEGVYNIHFGIRRAFRRSVKSTLLTLSVFTVCHPFRVIAVRSMVQFDGRETMYNSIISAVKEIYNNEGIYGFFAGLTPLILCRIGTGFIQHFLLFILEQAMHHWVPEHLHESYKAFKEVFATFVSGHIMYPLQLITTMMIINDSGLKASRQIDTPIFGSLTSCYSYLSQRGIRYRGSNIFFNRTQIPSNHSKLLY